MSPDRNKQDFHKNSRLHVKIPSIYWPNKKGMRFSPAKVPTRPNEEYFDDLYIMSPKRNSQRRTSINKKE